MTSALTRRPRLRRVPWLRWTMPALAAVWMLAGCAGMDTLRESEQATLMQRLPGHYDNGGPAAPAVNAGANAGSSTGAYSSAGADSGAAAALDLRITRVDAGFVGEEVFYVRLAVAGDPRRVLSQQIWSFDRGPHDELVQTVYLLADPMRWRGAAADLRLFQSITLRDLKPLDGCTLTWRRQGMGFEGVAGPACAATGGRAAGLLVDERIGVDGDGLLIVQRPAGADGRLTAGGAAERFRRRA